MENQKIAIELTVNDWNYVLGALGQRPYGEVVALLGNIQEQAKAKISELQSESQP